MTRFDKLVCELGIVPSQFEAEVAKFDLSPRAWLERRLRELGWVRVIEPVAPPECARPCCVTP